MAGRLRGLARTHGKVWRRRNTKSLASRQRGRPSRETRKKTARKKPPSQEKEKPQEGSPEEQQEGSTSSATVPKEREEGEQQPIDNKDSIEEKKGRVTHTTRASRTGGGDGVRSRSWLKTKAQERPPGNKGRDSRRAPHGAAGRPPPGPGSK